MTEETCKIKEEYEKSFATDPLSEEKIMIGETLTNLLSKDRNDRWHELIDNTDMTKNSKKAWRLIKKLNGDLVTHTNDINVTANQVATQLLLNGKLGKSGIINKKEKLIRCRDNEQISF
jgi:hypothetical protein